MKFFKKVTLLMALAACLCATGCVQIYDQSGGCLTCVDENGDHVCDVCTNKISGCIDFDYNHLCDVCAVSTSQCVDTDHDHLCDVCDSVLSGCTDTSADHHCDVCGVSVSACKDDNEDNRCDVCGKVLVEEATPVFYDVTYYVDGVATKQEKVKEGEKVLPLKPPNKEFADFIGWTTDTSHGNFYDFTKGVSSNLMLYAYYRFDYAAITNEVTVQYMDSVVTVLATFRPTKYSMPVTGVGSGVLYKFDNANQEYYLLTNNHVVYDYKAALLENREVGIVIRDYCDTEYEGTLLYNDAEYDLAIIKFTKSTEEGEKYDLDVLDLADVDPVVGQEVVAIGNPHGQKNAITYGQVWKYDYCNLGGSSSIDFLCVKHSAWMAQGSSGGLLMNLDFEVIGINFAVQEYLGQHTASWSIPVSRVKEFIENY